MNKFVLSAALIAVLASFVQGFDPLTLTVGTTSYVLTGTQTAIAVASLAGLAIAKEKLLIAAISARNNRGKRDTEQQVNINLDGFFRAIGESDVTDCGKFVVCHVMATPASSHQMEEKLIANLFDDLENIDPNTFKAQYQFAAYVGSLQQPGLCRQRYSRCPASAEELLEVVEAAAGNDL